MNSDDIRGYLLGTSNTILGAHGLLYRVEQRVAEQGGVDKPPYKTGSIMLAGNSVGRDDGEQSGLSETTFALYVALTQWLGEGIGWDKSRRTEQKLLRYLVSNRISDVEALTTGGVFAQVRAEVDRILPESRTFNPEDEPWQRAKSLIDCLLSWLEDDCEHDWELIADTDNSMRIATYRCTVPRCGAHKYLRDGDENEWVAV